MFVSNTAGSTDLTPGSALTRGGRSLTYLCIAVFASALALLMRVEPAWAQDPCLSLEPAQHSTAQHSTAQHSTAQHSTAQHSTAQHSTAQHSTSADVMT